MSRRDFHVLYVDAGSDHATVAIEVLNGHRKRLVHVPGQVEALAYLHGHGGTHHGRRRPDLILLNLPSPECRGFLTELKGDESFRRIPVVVMGADKNREDVLRAYDCHANCYVTRPETLEEFKKVLAGLEEFWFGVAKLPGT